MSTASKVAIASAAGVLAATAVGLATTDKGRKLTRQVEQKISPIMRRRWGTVLTAVEASLADHGVLRAIPASVREAVIQRLCMHGEPAANGSSSSSATATGSSGRRGKRSGQRTTRR